MSLEVINRKDRIHTPSLFLVGPVGRERRLYRNEGLAGDRAQEWNAGRQGPRKVVLWEQGSSSR